ncbi:MAG: LTA synthase family protein [Oscillospiraceae bacterium]|nr:LTA synthase family protein [Oscillospiraceae bacterium]
MKTEVLKRILQNPLAAPALTRFALFLGLFLYTELVFQLLTGTVGVGFLRAVLFILLGTVIFTLITLCLPKLAAFILSQTAVTFVSLLTASQLIYNKVFHEFYTVGKMSVAGDAFYHFNDIIIATIKENIIGVILLLLPSFALATLYFFRRFPAVSNLPMYSRRRLTVTTRLPVKYAVIPIVLLCTVRYSILIPVAADFHSPLAVSLGQSDAMRISSVSEVGLFTTMEIDLLSYVVASELSSVLDDIPELPVIMLTPPPPTTPAPTPELSDTSGKPEATPPPPPPWEGKFNSFDIDFDALKERDANNRGLLQLHEYFSSIPPSAQNEMTGIFEGYNLITISAEAFTKWVIDPELTPTLYKMQHDGVYFEDFYSIYGAGTIGGEFALVTGFSPRGTGGWCTSSARNYLPFIFASRFHDIGIQPLAYHNGSYTYYDRNILFPRLGYIFKAHGGGLNTDVYGWSPSDVHLMERTVDEYIDMERFYVHYMTVAGHSPYGFGTPMAAKHRDVVSHLDYSREVLAYLATQMELEYALEYLLERLEEAGIAERTLIVITSDHYPYGLEMSKTNELAGKRLDSGSTLHESAGIIYVKGMEPKVVSTPAFVPDMLPTVLNLLGLRFDSRFMPGRDVFSDAMPFVYLEGSVITEVGIYHKTRRAFTFYEGFEEVPDGYVTAILAIEAAKKSSIEQIMKLDYFDKIREYLE